MTQPQASSIAHRLARKAFNQLTCEEQTDVWRLVLAGYLFVRNNIIYLVKP